MTSPLDGVTFGDIHVSLRVGNRWTEPRSISPRVNTDMDEYHPSFSPDRRHFFFVRHTWNDQQPPIIGDIYSIPTRALLPRH